MSWKDMHSVDELRKQVVNKLSKLQLYAKDHPYEVTAGDESDIEHTAGEIMQLFCSYKQQVLDDLDTNLHLLPVFGIPDGEGLKKVIDRDQVHQVIKDMKGQA